MDNGQGYADCWLILTSVLTSDPVPNDALYIDTYRFQLVLSLTSTFFNLMVAIIAYSDDSYFSPHQCVFRALIFMDVVVDCAYVMDSFQSLLHPLDAGPSGLVSIADCSTRRSYLYAVIISRQWGAQIVLVMGLERFLFMRYPLWFKSIRVRKGPIIASTLVFSIISASIAYINTVAVAPEDRAYFTCEPTFAFGDYGWLHCFFVIIPLVLGAAFNQYAGHCAEKERVLLLFGNNRPKLASEKRKISKAKPIMIASLAFILLPQTLILALRLGSNRHHQWIKLATSQLFLCKCFANIAVYRAMTKRKNGVLHAIKHWLEKRRKTKVNPNDSITSISHQVRLSPIGEQRVIA